MQSPNHINTSQTVIGRSTNLNQDSTERCQGTLTANDNLVPTSKNEKDDEIKFQIQPSLTDAVTPKIVKLTVFAARNAERKGKQEVLTSSGTLKRSNLDYNKVQVKTFSADTENEITEELVSSTPLLQA